MSNPNHPIFIFGAFVDALIDQNTTQMQRDGSNTEQPANFDDIDGVPTNNSPNVTSPTIGDPIMAGISDQSQGAYLTQDHSSDIDYQLDSENESDDF